MPVQRQQPVAVGPLAEMPTARQQRPGAPRVLAADQVGGRQHVACPGRKVTQVPDRRGHQDEPAPPLLAHVCRLRHRRAVGTSRTSSWSPTRTPQRSREPARSARRSGPSRPPTAIRHGLSRGHPHDGEVGGEKGHVNGEFHADRLDRAGARRRAARPRSPGRPRSAAALGRRVGQLERAHHIAVPQQPSGPHPPEATGPPGAIPV